MTTLTTSKPQANTEVDAAALASNFIAIEGVVNGGIDQSNFASGKIFSPNKLTQGGAVSGDTLVWDGSEWKPSGRAGAPAGASFVWFSNVAPTGYRILDGGTVTDAQTYFPELYANVDPQWRSGVNVVLPDLRGRMPVGLNTANVNVGTLGKTEGPVALADRSPVHAHNFQTGIGSGYTHGLTADYDPPGSYTSGNTNLLDKPAYITVNWIIKL